MTTKTGEGLAQYALAQLGRPYWWGTFGQTASAALLAQKRAQYPEYYTADDFKSQFGQRVHDCVGLIKGYLWSETPKSTPVYCAEQDVAVSGLYRSCVRRGDIARMPQITGACVFMEGLGHVGVYVGDGYVVEASGHAKGVVRTRLKDRGWALWGLPGWISYGDAPADWAQGAAVAAGTEKNSTAVQLPLLRQGDVSEAVRSMQLLLIGRGYSCGSCGADGDFGTCTKLAVWAFQRAHGPAVDGVAGANTWSRLIGG